MSEITIENIRNKISENWDDQITTLKELIAIKSVAENNEEAKNPNKPFGEGTDEALNYMLSKGEEFGFYPVNVDGYGGHIEFGEGSNIMGIVVHLDCVPEGDGWNHEPFGGEIEDGKMYGRGTADDKGPTVASLFAMKALSDLGYKPSARVRMILGLDEETHWAGMDYYLENEEQPDFGFSPDADFPVINGEKGILVFDIAKKFGKTTQQGLELRSIRGGRAPNMVAADARAIVLSQKKGEYDAIKEKAKYFEELKGITVSTKIIGKSLEITTTGVSAHGSTPEKGVNAISLLMEFLGMLEFTNDDMMDFIEFYNEYIGKETKGKSIGCHFEDEASGETVFNVGMIDMDTKSGRVTINVRYPISIGEDDIYAGMDEVCSKYNLGIVKTESKLPLYVSPDSEFLQTLMSCYRECTGDNESEPLVIGGGTYARAFDNCVAFGARFPGAPAMEHQADEFICLDDLKRMTEIYALAIMRLTSGNPEDESE